MARWLLLLLVLRPVDVDPEHLVELLGDDNPAIREKATKLLAALGSDAIDVLRSAAEHPDAEIRTRASGLLRHIDQSLYFKSLAIEQRPRKIRLLTASQESLKDAAFTDGAIFQFEREPHVVQGEILGSIYHTRVHQRLDGEIEWSVVAIRAGDKDLPIEKCAIHSPEVVYRPGRYGVPCIVAIKGIRRWLCDVPVEFSDPAEGVRRRVGPFTLTVKWPEIELESDQWLPPSVVTMMLQSTDIQARPYRNLEKAPVNPKIQPTDEPAIFFPEAKETGSAWCTCAGEPDRSDLPPATSRRRKVTIPASETYLLHHLASLSIVLHVPIAEPFEVVSPPIK